MFLDRVEVCVPSSKTDRLGRGTTVVIPSQRDINVCPEKKLKEYLLERGSYSGSLFCHFDKTPLSRYQFNAVLKKALAYINIPGLSKPFIPYWNGHCIMCRRTIWWGNKTYGKMEIQRIPRLHKSLLNVS